MKVSVLPLKEQGALLALYWMLEMWPLLKGNQKACENAEENNFNPGNHLARPHLS